MEATFRGSREQLNALLRDLPNYLTGDLPDPTGEVERMYIKLGQKALEIIYGALLVKSEGDTDEAGEEWVDVKPRTRRRRRGKFRNQEVILRDTDDMFASLKPTGIPGAIMGQVFKVFKGGVAVGTSVVSEKGFNYPRAHNTGTKFMPKRMLWPPWEEWPDHWQQKIVNEIKVGASRLLKALIEMESFE